MLCDDRFELRECVCGECVSVECVSVVGVSVASLCLW